jgi:four helix bundle protein
MGIVEEESDESTCWLELLTDAGLISRTKIESLLQESSELTAIAVASIKTARRNTTGKPKP